MREYYDSAKEIIILSNSGTGTALILNVLVPVHEKDYNSLVELLRYRTDNIMSQNRCARETIRNISSSSTGTDIGLKVIHLS